MVMPMALRRFAALAAAGLALAGASAGRAQAPTPSAFTAVQAARGQAVYAQACAACHGASMQGQGNAPALAGGPFMTKWGPLAMGALVQYVQSEMPPGAGRSLPDADYLAVTAYVLALNGHAPGATALGVETDLAVKPGLPPLATGSSSRQASVARVERRGFRQREVANFRPVTDAMLDSPPDGDWLDWRRTRDGQGFSPLKQITAKNVGKLKLAWSLGVAGGQSPTPLAHDGILYFTNPGGILQALDGASGDVIWQYRYVGQGEGDTTRNGGAPRNIAIYGDKVFMQTPDKGIVAVDARTGKEVWRTSLQFENSSGPVIAGGVLIGGSGGCEIFKKEACYIHGHDVETGKELWRTYTIAQPGDPNDASWAGIAPEFRAGGDTWMPGVYDPKLDTFFIGTAQAKPWMAISRRMKSDDAALYTNATLALEPRTGRMKWWYQHIPAESLDMDMVFERVLIDLDGRPILITMGKDGILWKLDRRTGAYIDLVQTFPQTIYSAVDREHGKLTYRQDILDAKIGDVVQVCPGALGGRNWMSMSYDASTSAVYFPLLQSCGSMVGADVEFKIGGGGRGAGPSNKRPRTVMPGVGDKTGRFTAWDVRTMKELWSHTQRAMFTTAAMSTAGGVVFAGDSDRYFKAFDAKTGKVLWQTRLSTTAHGFPITYTAGGKQYVAAFAGQLSSLGFAAAELLPEIYLPQTGNALFVFELP